MSITPEKISVKFELDAKPAQKGLKNIEKTLKGFGKIGKANNRIFSDFLRLAGFAGLTKMTLDAARFGHSMQVLGQQTGIAVDKLSKMQNIWAGFGADRKAFSGFAQRMSSDLAGHFTGEQSAFYSAFSRMHIPILDRNKNIRDIKELFGDVAQYISMENVPDWVKQSKLSQWFGIPFEVSQYMIQGRDAWYQYLEEEAQKVGSLTEEQIRKNDELYKSGHRLLSNFQTSIEKATSEISDGLIPVLNSISNFAKENPLTTAVGGTYLGLGGGLLLGKLGLSLWKGLAFLPHLASLGLGGAAGYEIAKAFASLYDDSVKGKPYEIQKSYKTRAYEAYAEMLMDWYESGFVSSEELRGFLERNEYGGGYTFALLKEMTKNKPEVFRADGTGYSWQDFWANQDTTRAVRGGSLIDSHNIVNQENHFTINDMTADDAKTFGEKAATEIYNPLVWKAMTGGM